MCVCCSGTALLKCWWVSDRVICLLFLSVYLLSVMSVHWCVLSLYYSHTLITEIKHWFLNGSLFLRTDLKVFEWHLNLETSMTLEKVTISSVQFVQSDLVTLDKKTFLQTVNAQLNSYDLKFIWEMCLITKTHCRLKQLKHLQHLLVMCSLDEHVCRD